MAEVAPMIVVPKVRLDGEMVTVAPLGFAPVPLRATDCGVPVALSATESDAVRVPAAIGLNSMETVQLALAASDVPQVLAEIENDDESVAVSFSDVRVTADVPVFFTVTTCAADVEPTVVEANVSVAGESERVSVAGDVPVPEKATICGVPVALSATDKDAVSVAALAGLNSTETVQLALAASDAPQVLAEIAYDEGSVPVSVSDVRVTVAVPVFLMVTVCAAEVEPLVVEGNAMLAGESERVSVAGAVPVPERATVCGEPEALSATESDAVRVPVAAGLNSMETVQLALAARDAPQVFVEIP